MTTKATQHDYTLDTALPNDIDFIIEKAYFGFHQRYQAGQALLLVWEGSSPDADTETIIWSVGKGWESHDSGKTAVNSKRKGKDRFTIESMAGKLVDRVVNVLKVDLPSRGPMNDASIWEGLGFHMKREVIDYSKPGRPGQILEDRGGKTEHLMPISFLGEKKAGGAATATVQLTPQTTQPDSGLKDRLTKMAKVMERQAFQAAAANIKEVVVDPVLLSEVMDDGPGGFWAKART